MTQLFAYIHGIHPIHLGKVKPGECWHTDVGGTQIGTRVIFHRFPSIIIITSRHKRQKQIAGALQSEQKNNRKSCNENANFFFDSCRNRKERIRAEQQKNCQNFAIIYQCVSKGCSINALSSFSSLNTIFWCMDMEAVIVFMTNVK
jgi:hypothetical protein